MTRLFTSRLAVFGRYPILVVAISCIARNFWPKEAQNFQQADDLDALQFAGVGDEADVAVELLQQKGKYVIGRDVEPAGSLKEAVAAQRMSIEKASPAEASKHAGQKTRGVIAKAAKTSDLQQHPGAAKATTPTAGTDSHADHLEKVQAAAPATATAASTAATSVTSDGPHNNNDSRISSALAHIYALLPVTLAVGIPIFFTGLGVLQVFCTMFFWLLLWPASSLLEIWWWMHGNARHTMHGLVAISHGHPICLGFSPSLLAMAAHFYWTWGLSEVAIRNTSLIRRLLAVVMLAFIFLPVPFAHVSLHYLKPEQSTISALIGQMLGIVCFFCLRLSPTWQFIKKLPKHAASKKQALGGGAAAEVSSRFYLYDNLSGFWGGCRWPRCRGESDGPPDVECEAAEDDRSNENGETACSEDEGRQEAVKASLPDDGVEQESTSEQAGNALEAKDCEDNEDFTLVRLGNESSHLSSPDVEQTAYY
eukprot:TRINITY_DN10762_c0_g1_i1.p1 TRINITY_DN10762_c0_g1~~TRINITY_DN10762_c0_g1_i1.p1  ORF type:complete len:480 (-),score=82.28 TRINITY_DN10762_c0_g1_i1:324-1763(-)